PIRPAPLEWGSRRIARGEDRRVDGPADPNLRIVPSDRSLARLVVVPRRLVEEHRSIGEHEIAVREAFGDPELLAILGGEGLGDQAAICRGAVTDIDGDVEGAAGKNAN